MIKLLRKDCSDFDIFNDDIFSYQTTLVENNTITIDEVDYFLPSDLEKNKEIAEIMRNWEYHEGFSIVYNYFKSIEERNPSGKKNLESIVYLDENDKICYTQCFDWNIDNKIIKEYVKTNNTEE